MKHRNYYRVVGLLLAVMMVLSLVACGSGASSQVPSSGNSDIQSYEPPTSEPTNCQTEPLEPDPLYVTFPNSVETAAIVFREESIMLYEFGQGSSGYYLKNQYSCSYEMDDTTVVLSVYGDDGTLIRTSKYTFDGPYLWGSNWGSPHDFVIVSDSIGTKSDLVGAWYAIDDSMTIQFYSDGTFRNGEVAGSYEFTSKFDIPAVMLYDEAGNTSATYCYEFLDNDLMMLYRSDRNSALVFFRQTDY